MSSPLDDFEAARNISTILEKFEPSERERIIRWALEKLGQAVSPPLQAVDSGRKAPSVPMQVEKGADAPPMSAGADIRSFIHAKNPKSETQLAATVAYYYAFEAPHDERKDYITSADIQDAVRKAGWTRPKRPGQTLINAASRGVLDKGSETGAYLINSVGENLVAMVLSGNGTEATKKKKRKKSSSRKRSSAGKINKKS